MLGNYRGQYVTIDGIWLDQVVPFSIAQLINGYSSAQARANLLEQFLDVSQQLFYPDNAAAITEKQAFWQRWMLASWLPDAAKADAATGTFSCLLLLCTASATGS